MSEPEELFNRPYGGHAGMTTTSQMSFLVWLVSLGASAAAFCDLIKGVIQAENPLVSAFPCFPFL